MLPDGEDRVELREHPGGIGQSNTVTSREKKPHDHRSLRALTRCPIIFIARIEVPKNPLFQKEDALKKRSSNAFSPDAQNRWPDTYTLGFTGRYVPKNERLRVGAQKLSD